MVGSETLAQAAEPRGGFALRQIAPVLLLMAILPACSDESADMEPAEIRANGAMADIREAVVLSMFEEAHDQWVRRGALRPDVTITTMKTAAKAAAHVANPPEGASEIGCRTINVTYEVSTFDNFGYARAVPTPSSRKANDLLVYGFEGLFDSIPTKPGGFDHESYFWYVVVIGEGCPGFPSFNDTRKTLSGSLEIDFPPQPPIAVGYEGT